MHFVHFFCTLKITTKKIEFIFTGNAGYGACLGTVASIASSMKLNDANVSTVIICQGGEWNCVILSTTRTLPFCQINMKPEVQQLSNTIATKPRYVPPPSGLNESTKLIIKCLNHFRLVLTMLT